MRAGVGALLVFGLFACHAARPRPERASVPPPPTTGGAPAESPSGACEERTAEMERALREVVDPPHIPRPYGVVPPKSIAGEPADVDGPRIGITKNQLILAGEEMERSSAALDARRIAEAVRQAGTGRPVYLLVDRDLEAASLLSVLGRVDAGVELRLIVTDVSFRLTRDPPRMPEWVGEVLGQVRNMRHSIERGGLLAEAMTRAMGTCQSLHEGFAALAGIAPEWKAEVLRGAVIDGVRECQCEGFDLDAVESLALILIDPERNASLWLPLRLNASNRGGHTVRLVRRATVSDLVRTIEALPEDRRRGALNIQIP